jgi:hypothetical protein
LQNRDITNTYAGSYSFCDFVTDGIDIALECVFTPNRDVNDNSSNFAGGVYVMRRYTCKWDCDSIPSGTISLDEYEDQCTDLW